MVSSCPFEVYIKFAYSFAINQHISCRLAQSQTQDSATVSTDPSEDSSAAAPVEAEIPLSQDSIQEESSERMRMDKDNSRILNTSEVRLVPECDEDDDVIIPLPDDENSIQR